MSGSSAPKVSLHEGLSHLQELLAYDEALAEKIVCSTTKWDNAIFRATHLDVVQPDGQRATREMVWHHGGAGVLAIRNGRMCLVRQWRVSLGRITLEIPAGKLDPGEDGATAAARELAEETGIVARRLTLIAHAAGSVGFTDEMTRIYRAEDLDMCDAHPENGEFVEIVWIEPEIIVAAANEGIICDAKTIIAAYAAMMDKLMTTS